MEYSYNSPQSTGILTISFVSVFGQSFVDILIHGIVSVKVCVDDIGTMPHSLHVSI